MMDYLFILLACCCCSLALAQVPTQSIQGSITDSESGKGIDSVRVEVLNAPGQVVYTSKDGSFSLGRMPVGRYSLACYHSEYAPVNRLNVQITSGKALSLNIALEPAWYNLQTVTISAEKSAQPEALQAIGRHRLNMEQGKFMPGTLADPSRMLARFPGVSNPDDSRNHLVVRGNSPVGVSWYLEGLPSLNPNHFANAGNSGGGINILNPYTIESMDFYTGAFPASFGNALSAVVDVSLRKGNPSQREHHFRTSLADLQLGTEGPFSVRHKASYLAVYRRFNLDLAHRLSPLLRQHIGNAPNVQDFTVKLHFPHQNGATAWYSLGGVSDLVLREAADAGKQTYARSASWVFGLKDVRFLDHNSYVKSQLAYSLAKTGNGRTDERANDIRIERILHTREHKISTRIDYNRKLSAFSTLRAGILGSWLYARNIRNTHILPDSNSQVRDAHIDYGLVQAYMQWKWKPLARMQIQGGVHALFFSLNQAFRLEPRLRASYLLSASSSLAFAFGQQSQTQPSSLYLTGGLNHDKPYLNNLHLGFSESTQWVFTYQTQLAGTAIKIEGYYLHHTHIPDFKDPRQPKSFSGLNLGYDFGDDFQWISGKLDNTGTGRSYGIEMTIEKSFEQTAWILLTGSLYEAKYKGFQDVERNTAFNGNYAYNLMLSKEWPLAWKKNAVLVGSLSVSGAGGRRYHPVNPSTGVYEEDDIFAAKYKAYFRTDCKIGIQQNLPRFSHELSLDVRNVFNTRNVLYATYNFRRQEYEAYYQLGLLPLLVYQVNFSGRKP